MKNFKHFILAVFVAASIVACKKDDDGGGGGSQAAEGTISAKVDGVDFTSFAQATSVSVSGSGSTQTLIVTGSNLSGNNITLSINGGFEGVGSYNIGGGANVFVNGSYTIVDINNPMSGTMIFQAPFDDTIAGELNISAFSDTNVQGTFNFMAKNTQGSDIKNITDGSFNINR